MHLLVDDPRRLGVSYHAFVVTNAASAVVWGVAFVGVGYVLVDRWDTRHMSWASPALALAAAGVFLGIAVTARQRRRSTGAVTDASTAAGRADTACGAGAGSGLLVAARLEPVPASPRGYR